MSGSYIFGQQPAVDFERAHGVSGIAGVYTFPEIAGMDRQSLQNRIFNHSSFGAMGSKDFGEILAHLERLNPEQVAKMNFNRAAPQQVLGAVCGMVSGFNPDDINLFMQRSHGPVPLSTVLHSSEEVARKASEIKIMQRMKSGNSMGWVVSEPTLEKIWEQVKERPVIQSIERVAESIKNNAAGWIVGTGLLAAAGYVLWEDMVKRNKENIMKAAKTKVAREKKAHRAM